MVGGTLWALALLHIAAGGSRSAFALNDPLFWGAVTIAALALSWVTGRWAALAAALAAIAGGCTMIAVLLPAFPGFESNFPDLELMAIGGSLAVLSRQFGVLGALSLLALWIQAIVPTRARTAGGGRLVSAARGALLAALVLAGVSAGADVDARLSQTILGVLAGLVEARTRAHAPPSV